MADIKTDSGWRNKRVAWVQRIPDPASPRGQQQKYLLVPKGTYWANIRPLRPNEVYAAAKNMQSMDCEICMLDVGDIRTGDTLTVEGAHPTPYVVGVPTRPGDYPGWLVIMATAAVAP